MDANSAMIVRRATLEDAKELAQLYQQTVRQQGPARYTPEQVEAWASSAVDGERFARFITEPTTFVAQAEDSKRLLGFSGLEASGRVASLYVHADYGRQGIGSLLLSTLIEFAREQAIAHLFTEASHFSKPLFAKFCFEMFEIERVERTGVWFDRFRMQRSLH